MAKVEHQAIISSERAACACHRMVAIMRPPCETGGVFVKRAYAVWELHVAMAEADAPLFEYAAVPRPKPEAPQADLFGGGL